MVHAFEKAVTMPEDENNMKTMGQGSRLVSLDCYRGGVMLLMVLSSWRWLPPIINAYPDNQFLVWLSGQLQHLEWAGCTIWDMIQPSFMFMVGASLAFSVWNRIASGQSLPRMLRHAIQRAIILILLGIFLRSFAFSTSLNFLTISQLYDFTT